jgi:TolB protein
MKQTILALVGSAVIGALTLSGQGQPPPPPPTPQSQQDQIHTSVTSSGGGLPKLAIAGFIALSPDAETAAAAKTIGDVLYDDISYEREYYMIAKDAIATVPKPTSLDSVPLDRWKELNADGVIVGTVQKSGSGVLVKVKLIQVSTGKQAFGKEYTGSVANPRQYAHTISDEMYDQQLGLRGVARTKLAFSSDRPAELMKGAVKNRDVQEIYIVDYDGANPQRVTTTTTLNITPAWSPDNQAIAYTSYRPSAAGSFGVYQDVILSFIHTGSRTTPANGSTDRQNYLPAWSPDGSKLAFTSNRDGNPEIYVINKDGSALRRMTNNPAIDVSPTWSPTGNQLAWASDRTGNPKIYVMNADGTGQRLLIGDPKSDRPTWSRGKFNEIAYAAQTGPGYDIKIYSFATGETTRITDGIGSNESPAFAPNGRHIAFTSTRNGKAQLFTIDRDGGNLRQITREGNNKFASWSQ